MSSQKVNYYDAFHKFAHHCVIKLFLIPYYYTRYRVEIVGRENIPKRPYIIVSNHFSYSDPTIISMAISVPVAYIAKQELFKKKFLSPIITFLGAIPINRDKPAPSTLKIVKEAYKAKWPIAIFIEGTRNQNKDRITKLEQGAAFISKLCGGVQVLPLGISGGGKMFNKLRVKIGKPISFDAKLSIGEMTYLYGQAVADLAEMRLEL